MNKKLFKYFLKASIIPNSFSLPYTENHLLRIFIQDPSAKKIRHLFFLKKKKSQTNLRKH